MAGEQWLIRQYVDLATGQNAILQWPGHLLSTGDSNAHMWQVYVTRNGAPVDLTGAIVTCYVVRPRKDSTVFIQGRAQGNMLEVTFPKEVYAFSGHILAMMKWTASYNDVATVALLYANVENNILGDTVDPGNAIPSIEEMLALTLEMERLIDVIEGIQVKAITIPAGSSAIAEIQYVGNNLFIMFGIPAGLKGDQGVGGTSEIVEVITGEPGTSAAFSEMEDSTPENRKYIATIPAGAQGIGGTITIIETATGEPGTEATFNEAEGSTPENRKYIAVVPEGMQGVGGTSEIVEVITGEPGTSAAIEEADGSTPENRRYVVTIPAGESGKNFIVLGLYPNIEDLTAAHPVGSDGDAYAVGVAEDNVIYLWDVDKEEWVNIGKIQGPIGPEGPPGESVVGPPGPPGNLQYATFELDVNDKNLYVVTPDDYSGPGFALNYDARQLEVIINE